MSSRVRSTYIGFTLGVVLTVTLHIIFDYNYCIKNISDYQLNITEEKDIYDIISCKDVELEKKVTQRGPFVVFENYIVAEQQFKCGESITLTAPGDYRFLDNILPLTEKWKGPISVALYAPGHDFFTSLQSIAFLRRCTNSSVREFVTFHLFLEYEHMPITEHSLLDIYKDAFDCDLLPPYQIKKGADMYKEANNLTYPINVARNIAKLTAQTYFVFPSDIELYPTKDFIPKFFDFILENPKYAEKSSRNVFVVPIFEVLADQKIPENKTQLQDMYTRKKAITFHQNVCSPCHKIPQQKEWLSANESQSLNVFNVSKRVEKHKIWEPFFVCTQKEPLWDERLNWEGQGNKMSQAYNLCLFDYDFLVLDNAFLIHKPGVKKKKVQVLKHMDEVRKNNKILVQIQKELQNIYGQNKKCQIHNVFPQ